MSVVRRALFLVGMAAVFAAVSAGSAAAQGVVLGPDSKPLKIHGVRALAVFQERGNFEREVRAADNPEELLVELSLSAPATAGAVWVFALPGKASARPADAAAINELETYWRTQSPLGGDAPTAGQAAEAAPQGEPAREPGKAPAIIAGPMDVAALGKLLEGKNIAPGTALSAQFSGQSAAGWSFFLAEVPAGATKLVAHLSMTSEVLIYPGALGAVAAGTGRHELWCLPRLQLMVLHPHFLNIEDNAGGTALRLGLGRLYEDNERLSAGGHKWGDPASDRPGALHDSAAKLTAVSALVAQAAPKELFFLTVIGGTARSGERESLDFRVFSHYPTAMDPLPVWRSFVILGVLLVVVVVLAAWLLKRRELAP